LSYIEKEKWEGPYITVVQANPGFYVIYSYEIDEEHSQAEIRPVIAWRIDDRTDNLVFTEAICDDPDHEGYDYQGLMRPNGTIKDVMGVIHKSLDEFKKHVPSLVW
jgi:hypothetical protein